MSPFTERLNELVEKWANSMPLALRAEFRHDFLPLGAQHDGALDLIETIWKRQQQSDAFDESTGLARRRPFDTHLRHLVSGVSSQAARAIGVLFIDLDNLKRVNDTHGHAAGDQALAATGLIIRDALRSDQQTDVFTRAEAEHEHSIARHGGDEFLVALELKDPGDIEVVALRLKRRVDDVERQRERGYLAATRVTSSMGGVVYELPASPPTTTPALLAKELVRLADEHMYRSK